MSNKVALEIRSISCSQERAGAYALVLGEIKGSRNVLLIIVENGIYYSYLFLKAGENILRVDARPSDSIALALCMQAPILIDEELLNAEHLKEEFCNPHQWEYTDDPEILKAALQRAIDLEDYEEAAILRDKLNKQF